MALAATAVTVSPRLNALPIEPTTQQLIQEVERPHLTFVPARVGWKPSPAIVRDFNVTFEQYGPQATQRAVRASILAALTPDPVAMASLLFCAFALRWMRMRKETDVEESSQQAGTKSLLPKAA